MASVTHLAQYQGSKKQGRKRAQAERRERALKKRLNQIYELARQLKSEAELDTYLASIADDEVRAETKKLIEPFCTFTFRTVEIVSSLGQIEAMRQAPTMIPPAKAPKGLFTANADGAMPFEQDYREAERTIVHDDLPHDVQVRSVAELLAKCFELPVLELMQHEGFDAFLLKVRASQDTLPLGTVAVQFSEDDWRAIYGYVMRHLKARRTRATDLRKV